MSVWSVLGQTSAAEDFTLFNLEGIGNYLLERLWGFSSAGRAPALQAGGHRFDPGNLHHELGSIRNSQCAIRN